MPGADDSHIFDRIRHLFERKVGRDEMMLPTNQLVSHYKEWVTLLGARRHRANEHLHCPAV